MNKMMCEVCKVRSAVKNDILCSECSSRYALLNSALGGEEAGRPEREQSVLMSIQREIEPTRHSAQVAKALLEVPASRQIADFTQLPTKGKPVWEMIGYVILGIGFAALVFSVVFTSTILAFTGLGLVLWGVLIFFIRPEKHVSSNLMNATALSSLETIDGMMTGMGYRERGVYIPVDAEKAVVFIPAEPFSKIPTKAPVDGSLLISDPRGLMVVPPGLALSNLIEKKLGFDLRNCGVETLVSALPKAIVEDLEIAQGVEFEIKDEFVKIRLTGSVYADFCRQLRDNQRPCGLGCPMCSALACILAIATGKPVVFEEDREITADGKTSESNYRLVSEPRL